ncbi:ATP-binding protein [Candidatus Lucifugimonas marina]|uniref:DUF87 domain-containing protein n=1 Tax=Candidatus Lucifugimonas marina TaxID=3038979 RepID=A0AAJ5ZID3_9CHLR|nr:DUF87 domain-containing protein [SAR202 cluster bacterium JH639]WFG36001.1 DUF87 domain-containing protein [SAR202 cluster bacterium JH545]WFG39945.1 DUF87 domain-containing protein [SAR202 cluster bacterium JH1073]
MSLFDQIDELRIGHIVEVSGNRVRAELSGDVTELTRNFQGRVYPIGQIGSIVKIHFGRRIIFGFVSLLRLRSEEPDDNTKPVAPDADQRLIEVDLFAEGFWNTRESKLLFSRGVSTYPLPRQNIYLLTSDETTGIYQAAEGSRDLTEYDPLVSFAGYVGGAKTPCRANIDAMFGMHCAVLGSTGSGKSGAVAALLHGLLNHVASDGKVLSPRIVNLDPHGEYRNAFKKHSIVYRAYDPIGTSGTVGTPIELPYWLMSADEFRMLVIAKTEQEATSQNNIVYKALTHARMVTAGLVEQAPSNHGTPAPTDDLPPDEPRPKSGVTREELAGFDRDKPIPFSLEEFHNHIVYLQAARQKKGTSVLESVTAGDFSTRFASIVDKLNVLRRDKRLQFLMSELVSGHKNLAEIIYQLIGKIDATDGSKPDIRIIDISGLPNEVAGPVAAMIARLLFQYKLYQSDSERERDPVLLVCEEAHRYVPNQGEAEYAAAQTSIRRIAREGRKYGIGLMLVSQRPSDVDSTVLSQFGTWLVLRLSNSSDQRHVSTFLPDGLSGMTHLLPSLAQQEALFVGEGAALPARVRVNDLNDDQLPKSNTALYARGWGLDRLELSELETVASRMID